jgi:hypothetical protein
MHTSSNCKLLTKHGITHVVNCTTELPNHFESDATRAQVRQPVLPQVNPNSCYTDSAVVGLDHELPATGKDASPAIKYLRFDRIDVFHAQQQQVRRRAA